MHRQRQTWTRTGMPSSVPLCRAWSNSAMNGRSSVVGGGLAEFPPPTLDLRPIYPWLPLASHCTSCKHACRACAMQEICGQRSSRRAKSSSPLCKLTTAVHSIVPGLCCYWPNVKEVRARRGVGGRLPASRTRVAGVLCSTPRHARLRTRKSLP